MSSRPPEARARISSEEDSPPRTLIEAWREEPLDPVRVQRAFSRFRRKSEAAPRRPVALLLRWVTFGVAIGMGSVYAASLSLRPTVHASASPPEASAAKPAPVVPRLGPRAPARPEPQVLDQPSLPSSVTPSQAPEVGMRAPVPAASSEQWRRAARGLREGDFDSANVALSELARRGSDADRESALLVRSSPSLDPFVRRNREPGFGAFVHLSSCWAYHRAFCWQRKRTKTACLLWSVGLS